MTIDCAGDLIRGYLDGEPLFEVVHAGHGTGGIGLYTHANPTAVFEEVMVSTPRWGTFHRFHNQSTIAAGTRLRLQASRRLLADGPLALRVVGADGRVQHRRSFVPASHYAPITPQVLRKPDGTAFVLVDRDADQLTAGHHRLRFEYAREPADATLEKRSERGDRTPEVTTIDIDMRQ